jgi:hypothetical protein
MTDKKQIKGLLDYISLKPGEEAEYAPNSEDPYSEDYVFGMGVGASQDAKHFAKIGKLYHETETIKEAIEQILSQNDNNNQTSVTDTKKISGRPKRQKALGIHQVRALILWHIAQGFPEGIRQDLTNRYMIAYVQKLGKTSRPLVGKSGKVGESEKMWPDRDGINESLEQSVSRGKTWWEIDHRWHSDKCYEFFYGNYTEKKP